MNELEWKYISAHFLKPSTDNAVIEQSIQLKKVTCFGMKRFHRIFSEILGL